MTTSKQPTDHSGSPLTVYSKPDCHLCDNLKDELNRRRIGFVEQTIVGSEEWYRMYRHRVPVVVGRDGREFDPPFSESDYRLWMRESG